MMTAILQNSPVPIYSQIKRQVKHLVFSGKLAPGQQLPSVRELAIKLRVNPNTVAKAYGELENEKVVYTVRGRGVFAAERENAMTKQERVKIFTETLTDSLVDAFMLGLDPETIRRTFDQQLSKADEILKGTWTV